MENCVALFLEDGPKNPHKTHGGAVTKRMSKPIRDSHIIAIPALALAEYADSVYRTRTDMKRGRFLARIQCSKRWTIGWDFFLDARLIHAGMTTPAKHTLV
jgi:hypothetical protein